MNAKVLIVEDEDGIRMVLEQVLSGEGYAVRSSPNGKEGLREFFSFQPDLVLLDVTMPQMDGWSLLGRIREVSEKPVILVTALDSEEDKVRGLTTGADDYIVKPFGHREVMARVESALRRSGYAEGKAKTEAYQDSLLTVHFAQHRAFLRGEEVDLTSTEFSLLSALVRNKNQVLTPDRLLDLARGPDWSDPEAIRWHIGNLRKKLGDLQEASLIETIRGAGYRYTPPSLT